MFSPSNLQLDGYVASKTLKHPDFILELSINTTVELSVEGVLGQKKGQIRQPPVHHPMDAGYDSVVDEPQLSQYLVSSW